MLILSKAPPENKFIIPKMLDPSSVKNLLMTSLLIPGMGINVPNLYIKSINRVNNILCFKSEFFTLNSKVSY